MAEASAGGKVLTLWWAFGGAIVSLVLGVVLYIWNIHRPKGSLEQTNVIAWLLIAMTPVLILFSVFPNSNVTFGIRALSATGAVGLFIWIWMFGVRSARRASKNELEETRAKLTDAENQLRSYTKRKGINSFDRYRCALNNDPEHFVGIATGDLENINGIDLWTNSENTHMKMSRINERSISATVRYLGAQVNDNGDVSADTISDELGKLMINCGRKSVDPHTVFVTQSGRLAERGVKRILHVASVQGQRGLGFTPVANVGRCVTEILKKANTAEITDLGASSILLPLFGTGQAGGDIEATVEQLTEPAVQYLRQNGGAIREVYFLAYSELELDACRAVLKKNDNLGPVEKMAN